MHSAAVAEDAQTIVTGSQYIGPTIPEGARKLGHVRQPHQPALIGDGKRWPEVVGRICRR
jgi:hypothetical protein